MPEELDRRGVIRGGDPNKEECELCGAPRPPGSTVYVNGEWKAVCPECEDRVSAARSHDVPPGDPTGAGRPPPHGNTTR